MERVLKFSGQHILAYLTLIFIGYISFIGITYLSDGDFFIAVCGALFIIFLFFVFFIGGQLLKGTESKFRIKIHFERFFVFMSPVLFFILMGPYAHFWTVYENNDKIVTEFKNAICISKQMFTDYEKYSASRIQKYDHMLTRIVNNRYLRPKEYVACGFTGKEDKVQKENKVKALELQLISDNYKRYRNAAYDWIDQSSGASVWNVFLLGNIKLIKSSIRIWHENLEEFSAKTLSDEEFHGYNKVYKFDSDSDVIEKVEKGLDGLKGLYTEKGKITPIAVLTYLICFLLLFSPYFIQKRSIKSTYTLFGRLKGYGSDRNRDRNKITGNDMENGVQIDPTNIENQENDEEYGFCLEEDKETEGNDGAFTI